MSVFSKNKRLIIGGLILAAVVILSFMILKSNFNDTLISKNITKLQPKSFAPVGADVPPGSHLVPPTVPEEIGLAMVYPQGDGVGMSKLDSNSFYPNKPGPLLTNHNIPNSIGESSFADPIGTKGAQEGARILKIKSTGNQMEYKPLDEAENILYAAAYNQNGAEVQNGPALINGNKNINYNSSYIPEQNLILQASPGEMSTLNNCETTYPNTEHIDGLCITDGDIPYGKIVNGKVNPRLVSRWESYTGIYDRAQALQDIDGLLYPKLNVLTNNN
jgi:hypothetical protein